MSGGGAPAGPGGVGDQSCRDTGVSEVGGERALEGSRARVSQNQALALSEGALGDWAEVVELYLVLQTPLRGEDRHTGGGKKQETSWGLSWGVGQW